MIQGGTLISFVLTSLLSSLFTFCDSLRFCPSPHLQDLLLYFCPQRRQAGTLRSRPAPILWATPAGGTVWPLHCVVLNPDYGGLALRLSCQQIELCDELAREGFVAVAPDTFNGQSTGWCAPGTSPTEQRLVFYSHQLHQQHLRRLARDFQLLRRSPPLPPSCGVTTQRNSLADSSSAHPFVPVRRHDTSQSAVLSLRAPTTRR